MNLFLLPIMFLLTCGLLCQVAISQESGTISGKVVSKRTEEIIVGATVSLVGENAKTLTDKKGRFRLEKLPLRLHTLSVRMIGYKDFSAEVALDNEKPEAALLVELEETDKEENEIEVIAYRENTQNSNLVLDAAYLQRLPGSVGDPVRALLLMPGIMPTNDYSSQLIVRGGGADQNLVLLENVEIFNPYRLFGTVSMFNPMTLRSINMWLGGFPARYGDRLSAVMDVIVREGTRSSAFSFTGDISVIDANLTAEGAISPLEGSWLVSLRRTYLDLLIGPALKISPIPNFTEGQVKVSLAPLANHRLEAFGFFSQDGTRRDVEERFSPTFRQTTFGQLSTQDYMLVATWKHFSSSGFGFLASISTYRNRFNSSFDQKIGNLALGLGDTLLNYIFYEQASALQKHSFLQRVYFSGAAHSIEAGFNVDWLDTQFGYERRDFFVVDSARAAQQTARFGTVRPASLNAAQRYFRLGIYVQDKIQWGALSLEPSLRFDYSDLIRKSFFSPRLSVRYALPDNYVITAAVGLFRQSPGIEKWIDQNPALLRLDFNDPTSILDVSDREALLRLQPESAVHYITGIEKWFGVAWLFRLEAYYKDFFDVIVQSARVEQVPEAILQNGQDPLLASSYVVRLQERRVLSPTPVNDARGRAFGFEISLEKNSSRQATH